MSEFDISVVVPCYNRANCVGKAIESALGQSTRAREVIVVDDGSTDASARVARSYGAKVRLLRTKNRGPAAARNLGMQEAQGEWVAFLDSDDVWHTEKLELQAQASREYPDAQVIFCDTRSFANGTISMPSRFALTKFSDNVAERRGELISFNRQVFRRILDQSGVITSAVMLKRSIPEAHFWERVVPSEDWALWLTLSVRYGFAAVDRVLVDMYIHSDNISTARGKSMRGDVLALESINTDPLLTSVERNLVQATLSRRRVAAVYYSLVEGDAAEARRLLSTIPRSSLRRSRRIMYWVAARLPGSMLREMARWRLSTSANVPTPCTRQ
jgi:glycosyltransferase involved in cell wall biosynthesis